MLPRLSKAVVGGVTDRTNAQRIGAQIAGYRLPEGYRELMALEILGTRFLTIGPADKQGMAVMLFQAPQGKLDPKDVEQQFTSQFNARISPASCTQFHPTGKETLAIEGKPTTFAISECESNGERRREEAGVFDLRGHPTMLMAVGRIDRWDEAALRAFSSSLR
jgi:hypothetical protein